MLVPLSSLFNYSSFFFSIETLFNCSSVSYPTDKLIHKSKSVVEYETPAGTKGLGSESWLSPDGQPIRGVAILVGETPDLWQLSVRIPTNDATLTSAMIQDVEREAAAAQLK